MCSIVRNTIKYQYLGGSNYDLTTKYLKLRRQVLPLTMLWWVEYIGNGPGRFLLHKNNRIWKGARVLSEDPQSADKGSEDSATSSETCPRSELDKWQSPDWNSRLNYQINRPERAEERSRLPAYLFGSPFLALTDGRVCLNNLPSFARWPSAWQCLGCQHRTS